MCLRQSPFLTAKTARLSASVSVWNGAQYIAKAATRATGYLLHLATLPYLIISDTSLCTSLQLSTSDIILLAASLFSSGEGIIVQHEMVDISVLVRDSLGSQRSLLYPSTSGQHFRQKIQRIYPMYGNPAMTLGRHRVQNCSQFHSICYVFHRLSICYAWRY